METNFGLVGWACELGAGDARDRAKRANSSNPLIPFVWSAGQPAAEYVHKIAVSESTPRVPDH